MSCAFERNPGVGGADGVMVENEMADGSCMDRGMGPALPDHRTDPVGNNSAREEKPVAVDHGCPNGLKNGDEGSEESRPPGLHGIVHLDQDFPEEAWEDRGSEAEADEEDTDGAQIAESMLLRVHKPPRNLKMSQLCKNHTPNNDVGVRSSHLMLLVHYWVVHMTHDSPCPHCMKGYDKHHDTIVVCRQEAALSHNSGTVEDD
jgi:hypothetical protein